MRAIDTEGSAMPQPNQIPRLGLAGVPEVQLFERGPITLEIRDRLAADDFGLDDEGKSLGEPFDDLEDVGGQKDRHSSPCEREQQIFDVARRAGIDALEWLIEEEHAR